MDSRTLLFSILVMAVVTAALRFLPFVIFGGRKSPAFVEYLSKTLPYAVMAMLVVYCLKDISFSSVRGFVPYAAGVVGTILSYLWRKNTIFSILAGTVIYMISIAVLA